MAVGSAVVFMFLVLLVLSRDAASAQQAATETIRNYEALVLRDEAREVFVKALLNPPLPNAALRTAAKRYKAKMGL